MCISAPGAQILQPVAGLGRDELPLIEVGVVRAQGVRHVPRLAAVTHDAILIEDLCALGEAHRAPVTATRPELATRRSELPIAEQVIEVTLMGIVGRIQLLPGSLVDGLCSEGWCSAPDHGEQGAGASSEK